MANVTGVGAIVFGLILILLGIGAYFSGEEAAQGDGRIAIGFAIILGLAAILGGVNAREKAAEKSKQAAQPATPVVTTATTFEPPPPPPEAGASAFCPYCGRGIKADFVVCPFCGKSVKRICPKCGGKVEAEYVACPYCGTSLKGA